jgi:hypothetical protein
MSAANRLLALIAAGICWLIDRLIEPVGLFVATHPGIASH